MAILCVCPPSIFCGLSLPTIGKRHVSAPRSEQIIITEILNVPVCFLLVQHIVDQPNMSPKDAQNCMWRPMPNVRYALWVEMMYFFLSCALWNIYQGMNQLDICILIMRRDWLLKVDKIYEDKMLNYDSTLPLIWRFQQAQEKKKKCTAPIMKAVSEHRLKKFYSLMFKHPGEKSNKREGSCVPLADEKPDALTRLRQAVISNQHFY